MTIGFRIRVAFAATLFFLSLFFTFASTTLASGTQADAMCNPVDVRCPCNFVMTSKGCQPGTNRYMCPDYCKDNTNNGITSGHCVAPNKCHGDKFSSLAGQSGGAAGLQQLGQILGQLLQQLMQPKPPSSASPPSAPADSGATGCVSGQFFQTSDVSQLSGNPCAQYVASTSDTSLVGGTNGGIDLSSELLGALGDQSGTSLSDALLGNTNTNTNVNGTTSILTGSTISVPQGIAGLVPTLPGVSGDIQIFSNGATIVAGSRSEQQNSEVAGFYGSGSFGGQPQSLVGQWCQARPWAGNFLSFIVPPTFFDSLCTWRGYQVGTLPPPAQQTPSLQQQIIPAAQATTTTTPASTGPVVPPKVDIWAVPPSVPLGARTTIFWNTQGVTNCTETSPDGSFNQSSLSGGAATIPITGATTFNISCLAPDNSHVTGYVVVNLSI